MADIIQFPGSRVSPRDAKTKSARSDVMAKAHVRRAEHVIPPAGGGSYGRPLYTRREARTLLSRATRILANLGDSERRISWILEDCMDLLQNDGDARCDAAPSLSKGR